VRFVALATLLFAANASALCAAPGACICEAPDIFEVTVTTTTVNESIARVDVAWPGNVTDAGDTLMVNGNPAPGTKLLIGTSATEAEGGFICDGYFVTREQALAIASQRPAGCYSEWQKVHPPRPCRDTTGCGCSHPAAAAPVVLLLLLQLRTGSRGTGSSRRGGTAPQPP
jgi:hypothetical protein